MEGRKRREQGKICVMTSTWVAVAGASNSRWREMIRCWWKVGLTRLADDAFNCGVEKKSIWHQSQLEGWSCS